MDQGITDEQQLRDRVAALGNVDDQTRNAVVCALVGHSKIITGCFGYQYCGRCEALVGDTLGGVGCGGEVVVGHDCPTCRENYSKLDWRHKVFAPHPFRTDAEAEAA